MLRLVGSHSLLASLVLVGLAGCAGDEVPSMSTTGAGEGTGTSSGDGDGDGDASSGDGDGDDASSGDGDGDAAMETATYWKDTKAIIDASCGGCHVAGGIGPFALETYEQVANFAPLLEDSIADLTMPPWPPSSSCNTYENERRLSDAERELVLGWFADSFPEGDPADEPPGAEPPPAFEPDFTVQLPTAYTPEGSPDDYRCFIIPWPEAFTEPTFVVGQNVYPDQVQQVHHVITFFAEPEQADFFLALDEADPEPGYQCFGGPGTFDWSARWLGDWVPGKVAWKRPRAPASRSSRARA